MTLFDDLRFATRGLLRTRHSTSAVVSVLAIVLGVSTAVFTIVNAMTRGLPVDDADELVSLSAQNALGRGSASRISISGSGARSLVSLVPEPTARRC